MPYWIFFSEKIRGLRREVSKQNLGLFPYDAVVKDCWAIMMSVRGVNGLNKPAGASPHSLHQADGRGLLIRCTALASPLQKSLQALPGARGHELSPLPTPSPSPHSHPGSQWLTWLPTLRQPKIAKILTQAGHPKSFNPSFKEGFVCKEVSLKFPERCFPSCTL